MIVRDLVAQFLEHCERHRKPNTTRAYRSRLKSLIEQMGDREASTITLQDVEAYLVTANTTKAGKQKSADTRRALAVAVEKLFRFALERKLIEAAIFEKLEKPRGRRRERIPTADEDRAIEAIAPPAFRLVFAALRRTGARPGELAAAQLEDYDRGRRLIVIRDHKTATVTGKVRKIGVGKKLEAILAEAIGDRTTGSIFLAGDGKPWTTQRLSKTYKRLCRRAKLADDLCLYLARHKHATELCEKAGIHATAMALGHSSIQTTMRYVHADDGLLSTNQDLVD